VDGSNAEEEILDLSKIVCWLGCCVSVCAFGAEWMFDVASVADIVTFTRVYTHTAESLCCLCWCPRRLL
jgi:hypothetical protein